MKKKKLNSREILRIKKLTSEFSDIKKLKPKHFIQKDRILLNKKLDSDRKKIKRLVSSNLKETTKDIKELENLKKECKMIVEILNEDLRELNSKLRLLNTQIKKVSKEKRRLSKKKVLFKKKILQLNISLKLERKRRRVVKKRS